MRTSEGSAPAPGPSRERFESRRPKPFHGTQIQTARAPEDLFTHTRQTISTSNRVLPHQPRRRNRQCCNLRPARPRPHGNREPDSLRPRRHLRPRPLPSPHPQRTNQGDLPEPRDQPHPPRGPHRHRTNTPTRPTQRQPSTRNSRPNNRPARQPRNLGRSPERHSYPTRTDLLYSVPSVPTAVITCPTAVITCTCRSCRE